MSGAIPTLPLNDKRAIPAIGSGTGTALFGKDATGYVVQAIEGGFNHIDTTQIYGNEESVGEALREVFGKGEKAPFGNEKVNLEGQAVGKLKRDDIWVTTKYSGQGDAEIALDVSLNKVSCLHSL
jgi:diketogulonate reductase-like aldo/keto reductase